MFHDLSVRQADGTSAALPDSSYFTGLLLSCSSRRRTAGNRARGFTLTELLVAISLIGVLLALLMPAVMAARNIARRGQCANQLRQLGLALQSHHEARNSFPPGLSSPQQEPAAAYMTWIVRTLPYWEQADVWNRALAEYGRQPNPFHPAAHWTLGQVLPGLSCPSNGMADERHLARNRHVVALTDYLGCVGTNYQATDGILFRDSRIRAAQIKDGTSNTIILGERPPSPDAWFGWWYAGVGQQASGVPDMLLGVQEINIGYDALAKCPGDPRFQPGSADDMCATLHFWSFHPQGAHFAFADGSVHFVRYGIASPVLAALATRANADVAQPSAL